LDPVKEGGDPRVDGRSSHPTAPTAEGHDANEVPGLVRLWVLQSSLPPEQSSSRVPVAGVLAFLSPRTDLGVMIYAGSRTVVNKNRNLQFLLFFTVDSFFGGDALIVARLTPPNHHPSLCSVGAESLHGKTDNLNNLTGSRRGWKPDQSDVIAERSYLLESGHGGYFTW